MVQKITRLHFIDAMRAWAILMMLQGHFVDGLLDTVFRDPENNVYTLWKYFRGITAPVFFTVSGFIFTYLLIRVPLYGLENPRIKKGVRRGIQLVLIGYALRLNLFGLLEGKLYDSFFFVDVLHCIGISILTIIGIFWISARRTTWLFPTLLLTTTVLLFMFEPIYKEWNYAMIPEGLANYFTRSNGSVFTVIPWVGYTAFGAFLSVLFTRFKNYKNLYSWAISLSIIAGLGLLFWSSPLFVYLNEITGVSLYKALSLNNYLFIRLGDVMIVFAIFMIVRRFITHSTFLRIGQNTLSIYVIHFIILYGSFTGLGLYNYFHHTLTPGMSIAGAVVFMIVCSFVALKYERNEEAIKNQVAIVRQKLLLGIQRYAPYALKLGKDFLNRLHRIFKVTKG